MQFRTIPNNRPVCKKKSKDLLTGQPISMKIPTDRDYFGRGAFLSQWEFVTMTFRKQIEALLRVAENHAEYGRRLAASVTAARVLMDEITAAESESAAVVRDYRDCSSYIPQRAHNVQVSHGYTADDRRAAVHAVSVVSRDNRAALDRACERAARLSDRLEILDQYLAAFRDVRAELLRRRGDRLNGQHTALLSMLLATEPSDKWDGSKIDRDHCGGINGELVDRVEHTYRQVSGAGDAINNRATFGAKSRKRGRISRKGGERLWSYGGNRRAAERGGDSLERSDTVTAAARQLARGGGRRAAELAAALSTWGQARGGWTSTAAPGLGFASEHQIRGALAIRRRGITAGRAAAARRLIDRTVASPSGAQSLAISAPETVGAIRRGAVEYSVLRWRVLIDCGATESWEYGLAHHDSPEAECIPDHVQTVHRSIVDDPLAILADDAAAIETLTERIEDAERRAEYRRRERRSAAERREEQRQRTARVARALLSIPRVALSDSYAVGNCRPGTREFCERIGVTESSLTGAELCRRWQRAGWPDNSLFVRVVERLAVGNVG